jgi:hypothetical protein
MPDYIPREEAARIAWLERFAVWMNAHGTTHGFSPGEVAEIVTAVTDASTAMEDNETAQAAARAATVAKNSTLAVATDRVRQGAQRLQIDPNTTNAERAAVGITVRDKVRTLTSPDAVRELVPPDVRLDFSKRLQVTIHWGLNPHNEHENARPAGTLGVQIQYHRGGIPEHEHDWITLDIDTESPFIHVVHEDTPTTYAYRACWIDKKANKGPYGDPAVCTVSV